MSYATGSSYRPDNISFLSQYSSIPSIDALPIIPPPFQNISTPKSQVPIFPNISSKFPSSTLKSYQVIPPAKRSSLEIYPPPADLSAIYLQPPYELQPSLNNDPPIELPVLFRPLRSKFPRNPYTEGEDELNGIGDTDPGYGISQEWLIFQRQGDQYDRIAEWNPDLVEGYNYDKLPNLNPYQGNEVIDYEYERLLEYQEDQEQEEDEQEEEYIQQPQIITSELIISVPQYPLKVIPQTRSVINEPIPQSKSLINEFIFQSRQSPRNGSLPQLILQPRSSEPIFESRP